MTMRAPGLTNTDRLLLICIILICHISQQPPSKVTYHTIIRSVIIINYDNETRKTKKFSFFMLLHFHRKGLVFEVNHPRALAKSLCRNMERSQITK